MRGLGDVAICARWVVHCCAWCSFETLRDEGSRPGWDGNAFKAEFILVSCGIPIPFDWSQHFLCCIQNNTPLGVLPWLLTLTSEWIRVCPSGRGDIRKIEWQVACVAAQNLPSDILVFLTSQRRFNAEYGTPSSVLLVREEEKVPLLLLDATLAPWYSLRYSSWGASPNRISEFRDSVYTLQNK